ncbi:MAG: hypothetical protein QY325_06390 [Flavobacteriales bacterium]|nr:MAG: hypothetical protein QY325_06390 [Flavobacteriales bacterium]
MTKLLDKGDRAYLKSRINPIVDYLANAMEGVFELEQDLANLLKSAERENSLLDIINGLNACAVHINALAEMARGLRPDSMVVSQQLPPYE